MKDMTQEAFVEASIQKLEGYRWGVEEFTKDMKVLLAQKGYFGTVLLIKYPITYEFTFHDGKEFELHATKLTEQLLEKESSKRACGDERIKFNTYFALWSALRNLSMAAIKQDALKHAQENFYDR